MLMNGIKKNVYIQKIVGSERDKQFKVNSNNCKTKEAARHTLLLKNSTHTHTHTLIVYRVCRYSQFITSSRVTPRGGRRHTAGQCHVIPTDAHVHCSAMSSLWWSKKLRTELRTWFERGQTVFRDYFCSLSSVNPPGCHRLHKPIVGKIIRPHTCMHAFTTVPEFHMKWKIPDTAIFTM